MRLFFYAKKQQMLIYVNLCDIITKNIYFGGAHL